MDIEVEEMEAKWQYGVALWVFLGGMNICVSQKIKYEALMKTKGE